MKVEEAIVGHKPFSCDWSSRLLRLGDCWYFLALLSADELQTLSSTSVDSPSLALSFTISQVSYSWTLTKGLQLTFLLVPPLPCDSCWHLDFVLGILISFSCVCMDDDSFPLSYMPLCHFTVLLARLYLQCCLLCCRVPFHRLRLSWLCPFSLAIWTMSQSLWSYMSDVSLVLLCCVLVVVGLCAMPLLYVWANRTHANLPCVTVLCLAMMGYSLLCVCQIDDELFPLITHAPIPSCCATSLQHIRFLVFHL